MTVLPAIVATLLAVAPTPPLTRSAGEGPWSAPATWEGRSVPEAGARVQIRPGHRVVYDLASDTPIRSIHVAGTLEFAQDRATRLVVGLIKVQPGEDSSENGFDCDAHDASPDPTHPTPSLLVGRPGEPIAEGVTATIRLKWAEGLDPETCPAILSCGGRMEFHGTPMRRTWTKLAREAFRGESIVLLDREAIEGWKAGDHLVLTGTSRQYGYKQTRTTSVAERPATEERTLLAIKRYNEGNLALLTLDNPLEHDHRAQGETRGEVANLTRNVIVESAEPDAIRGHTMYHKGSSGSVSYAEFRHLGKEGRLGKYSLHFHLAGNTMRGGSVVGASIWDSKNRWLTIHGTSYLVVRDCVGYRSIGHGFFLEDGTETRNVLDGNLAIMALRGKPLPDQVLPFDGNLGSGFWWANSLNAFTHNVAAECDQDGFRFEVLAGKTFDPVLPILQADGSRTRVDVRTVPFLRFEGNEAHAMRFFGLNLGGFTLGGVPGYEMAEGTLLEDVDGVGPDSAHPFVIQDFRAWDCHWPFHAGSPCVLIRGMTLSDSQYGLWRSNIDRHEYADLRMDRILSFGVFAPRPGRAPRDNANNFLKPVDDLPPSTMIHRLIPRGTQGGLTVQGSAIDNNGIRRVVVNGQEARSLRPNFAEWAVDLEPGSRQVIAHAEDLAGNVETTAHERPWPEIHPPSLQP